MSAILECPDEVQDSRIGEISSNNNKDSFGNKQEYLSLDCQSVENPV